MGLSASITTAAGVVMPRMIYGTAWKKERTRDLVIAAVRAGFRGIDTACQPKHYDERGVGQALQQLLARGEVRREELFIQTKYTQYRGQDPSNVPYDKDAPIGEQVDQSLAASLANLQLEVLDSWVLHSPLATHAETMEVGMCLRLPP
eukprot:SAG31_NODE_4143_length_3535_cov_2.664726_3_plen_148_part_00